MKPGRFFKIVLITLFAFSHLTTVVRADIVTTEQVVEKYSVKADKEHLSSLLARDDIRQQLRDYGVDPEEAEMRLAALSDREIQEIADRLEKEPAGAGELGTVLGVALTVFLVLLITDILCLTDVFSFTRCSRN